MKYIVVTGANGGIGQRLSFDLIDKGYTVFGVDLLKPSFSHERYIFIKCDVTSNDSFSYIVEEIKKRTDSIFMIYHLAGIFMLQTMLEGSEDDLRKIIEINFFGVYRINRLLFPFLNKESRIVIFSSEVARYSPQPFNGYYALSKILVDKYGDILRRECNYLGIKVIKVQSGAIKTNLLNGVNKKYDDTLNSTKYYKKPLTKLRKLMDDEIKKQTDPKVASNVLLKLTTIKHPKFLYKVRNSFKLRFLNALPECLQDYIYKKVIN